MSVFALLLALHVIPPLMQIYIDLINIKRSNRFAIRVFIRFHSHFHSHSERDVDWELD